MKRVRLPSVSLILLLAPLAGCDRANGSSGAGAAASAAATAAPPSTAATAAPAAVDPFKWGFCELSLDGAPATKHPGGGYKVASRHWADGPNRAKVEPLILNCGPVDLSTSTSNEAQYPMKAGKYKVAQSATQPGWFVSSTVPNAKGDLVIDAWDKSGIRGSFELTGTPAGKATKYAGKFDFKCPPTLACK